MKKTLSAFLIVLFALVSQELQATGSFTLKSPEDYTLLSKNDFEIWVDSSDEERDINEVASLNNFIRPDLDVTHLPASTHTLWIRLTIVNAADLYKVLVTIQNPVLEKVSFFYKDENGVFQKQTIDKNTPFNPRKYHHQNCIFELPTTKEPKAFECFICVRSYSEILVPIYVGGIKSTMLSNVDQDYIFGIYTGIMLVIFLYNFFILLTVRDRSYLYYIMYIFSVAFVQISLKGFGFKYIWPGHPFIENFSPFFFSAMTAITSIAFIRNFLHVKENAKRTHVIFHIINVLYLVEMVVYLSGQHVIAYNMLNLLAMILSLLMMYVAIYIRVKKRTRSALFFIVAWAFFLGSVVVFVLKDVGVLPFNAATTSSLQIGSAMEAIMLSIALADRINVLKREKEESQAEALSALQENERIVREQNIMLEQKVEERTIELSKTNRELDNTLHELKDAQTQLVDAEKMASLGQLTAGVAHEINNPINFVSSNIRPLKRDIEDMMDVLKRYENIHEGGQPQELKAQLEEIKKFKEQIDFTYLLQEIEVLLTGMDEGASRTVEIVKSLKNFSRLDEADLKNANINEGINSTLILLNTQLGDKIRVVKELGNLPDVECYPGKLNQVFMNILNNAIYAVKKKHPSDPGLITVKTSFENDMAIIRFADNGMGIAPEVKPKIFEPFFTTKDVGEGTGLGLSIVYKIIENHKGSIEVVSELGHGTEFIIKLPKSHK